LGEAGEVKVVFDAELWLWDARRTQTWTFVSLPADASEEIRDLAGGLRRGFGSLRVRATIGGSSWTTSIFPASESGYVLPVKRPVRTAEALDVGDTATVTVELIDFALPGNRTQAVLVLCCRSLVSNMTTAFAEEAAATAMLSVTRTGWRERSR
jgi:hypothetical protein